MLVDKNLLLLQRVEEEMTLLQKAQHPNICQLFGWTKWRNHMALVLKYEPGGNLKQLIQNRKINLFPFLLLRIANELASAIAFIHDLFFDQPIVHGDLKPENVLLTSDIHCLLADFGCSEISIHTGVTTPTVSSAKCQRKNKAFTEIYAAPERLKDPSVPLRKSQDTYSFGMLLYMLLTQKPICRNEEELNVLKENIKEGKTLNTEAIEFMKERFSNAEDQRIISFLTERMHKCRMYNPNERPKMNVVSDQLQNFFSSFDADYCGCKLDQVIEKLKAKSISKSWQFTEPLEQKSFEPQNYTSGKFVL